MGSVKVDKFSKKTIKDIELTKDIKSEDFMQEMDADIDNEIISLKPNKIFTWDSHYMFNNIII